MKCMYCGATASEMYAVREAIKPPHTPYRWKRLGHCCETCEAEGHVLSHDKWGHSAQESLELGEFDAELQRSSTNESTK